MTGYLSHILSLSTARRLAAVLGASSLLLALPSLALADEATPRPPDEGKTCKTVETAKAQAKKPNKGKKKDCARDRSRPTKVTGLTATPGNGTVTLAWTASTDNVGVTGYRVYRTGHLKATVTETTYSDSGLKNGRAYSYKVIAIDAAGNRSVPALVKVKLPKAGKGDGTTPPPPPAADTEAPTSPGNLTAEPRDGGVKLTWEASTDNVGVTEYRIMRDGAELTKVQTNSYEDSGLQNGTTYSYEVVAVDAAGNASAPASAQGTPEAPAPVDPPVDDPGLDTPPSIPAGLTAAANGIDAVDLSWTASTDDSGVEFYNVYRSTSADGQYTLVDTPATTSYSDSGLTPGTYYYKVAAVDTAGQESDQSGPATVFLADPVSSPALTGFSLTASLRSSTCVGLYWKAPVTSSPVAKYRLYRTSSSGTLLLYSTTSTSYSDCQMNGSPSSYKWQVVAYDIYGREIARSKYASVLAI